MRRDASRSRSGRAMARSRSPMRRRQKTRRFSRTSARSGLARVSSDHRVSWPASRGWPSTEERRDPGRLSRLESLKTYPFTALVLGADIDEEQVAEVFVRINSHGKTLNQADFILTLMSVFWDEGRSALEQWSRERACRATRRTTRTSPDPDQLLRVAIALGFRRGRLEDAYGGSSRPRSGNRQGLARASREAIRATGRRAGQGARQGRLEGVPSEPASSRTSLVGDDQLEPRDPLLVRMYLIGKHDYGVKLKQLREVMARWFFMSSLTARYSFSPETTVAADLRRFRRRATPMRSSSGSTK